MDGLNIDEGKIAMLQSKRADEQGKLGHLNAEFETKDWDANIKSHNITLRELDVKRKEEQNELVKGTQEGETRGALASHKRDLETKRTALNSL